MSEDASVQLSDDAIEAKLTREPYLRRACDDDKMNLPPNKTCSDCYHFRRCNAMFGHEWFDEICDWSPSRFHEKRPTDSTLETS